MKYTISISKHNALQATALYQELHSLTLHFHAIGIECILEERLIGDRYFYFLSWQLRRRSEQKMIRYELAKRIIQFIVEHQETKIIHRFITKKHGCRYPGEMEQIEEYVYKQLKKKTQPYLHHRSDPLQKNLEAYLQEHTMLAVDGYCFFRMHQYHQHLASCVSDGIEEYLLDKEYQDFIQLLKYFVSIQPAKVPIVHVIHRGKGQYHLCHADGSTLQSKDSDPAFSDALSREDLIISTLLTMAPERVFLHTRDAEENVIRTVIQVFEGRIVLCRGCQECDLSIWK